MLQIEWSQREMSFSLASAKQQKQTARFADLLKLCIAANQQRSESGVDADVRPYNLRSQGRVEWKSWEFHFDPGWASRSPSRPSIGGSQIRSQPASRAVTWSPAIDCPITGISRPSSRSTSPPSRAPFTP